MFPVTESMFISLEGTRECLERTKTKNKNLARKSSLTIGTNFNRTAGGYILERCNLEKLRPEINLFCVLHNNRRYISYFLPNTDRDYEYDPCSCNSYWNDSIWCCPITIEYRTRANIKRPKTLNGEWTHLSCELKGGAATVPDYLVFEPRLKSNNKEKISQIIARTYGVPVEELLVLHYNTDNAMKLKLLVGRNILHSNLPEDRNYYTATLDFLEEKV